MNQPIDPSCFFKRALAAMALASLTACGPGTVGTGAQEDYLKLAQAQTQPVCAASWTKGRLDCGNSVAIGENHPGTLRVQYASAAAAPDYLVVFEGNQVRVSGGCPRRSFEGEWSQLKSGGSAFVGGFLQGTQTQAGTALAEVTSQGSDGQPQLRLLLLDVDKRVLLGPLTLQKVGSGDLPLAPC
ncbi:hypothetical protein [Roseateles sp.]|uniref:hypothetical protein n=1 Tax=Roseateles sp. TaxID=1971397 RepID=UPI003D0FE0CE